MATEILKFDLMEASTGNKFELYNRNLRQLEAMTIAVQSRLNGGPPGSPIEGQAFIVDNSTGDWSSFPLNSIAHYYLGSWKRYEPAQGQRVSVLDENALYYYNGTVWQNILTSSLGFNTWLVTTTNITLSAGDRYFVDTGSSNITITLPPSPSLGDRVEFQDVTLLANQTNGRTNNNITINPNGSTIEEQTTITSDLPGKSFVLQYAGPTYGWRLVK